MAVPAPLAQNTPDIVLESVFKYFDKDGSGELDHKEFHAYLKSLGLDKDDMEAEALKALSDDNNDGKISLVEFKNFVKQDKAQKIVNNSEEFQFLVQVKEVFNKYDKSNDGKISWDEWKKELLAAGKTEKEAKELFDQTDQNKNGVITFDEFYHSIIGQ